MFKKLISKIRGGAGNLSLEDFTLEHCIEGVCQLAAKAKEYDKETARVAIAESLLIPINKQRETRSLPALSAEHFANLYDQANGSMELLAHLVYETGIGHR